jgi:hypothetical protein
MIDFARLAPATPAMLDLIAGPKARPVERVPMRARLARLSSNAAAVSGDYGDVALRRELDELRVAQPGTRNHALNKAAYALYQLVDAGVLDRANMEAALIAVGMGLGLGDFEVAQTLRSAEEGAAKNPRGAGRLPSARQELPESPACRTPASEQVEEPLHYPTLRSRLLTTPEMLSRPPPEPLLGDILFKNTLAALYGHPGSMKSFLALDWCLSLAKDYQWFDKPMAHGARCLYVAAEGVAGIGPRVRAWIHGHSGIFDESFPNMEWYPEAINLLDPLWVDALAWHASLTLPSLVVVDTLSRSIPGGDENNAIDMTGVIASLDRVRLSSGATILVVHHSPKGGGGGLRGHSSLHGACDSEIEVSRDESHLLVKCAKQKDAEAFSDINLWWKPVEGYPSIVLTDIPQDVDDGKIRRDAETVWARLRGHYAHTGATKALLVEATGLTEREVMEAVNCLFDQNRIQKEGTGFRARA